jgi:hypothetical protein
MHLLMWHETGIPFSLSICTNNEIHSKLAEVPAFAISTFTYLPLETLHFFVSTA